MLEIRGGHYSSTASRYGKKAMSIQIINYYLLALLLSSIMCLVLALRAWTRRKIIGSRQIAVTMIGAAIWSFGYFLEMIAPTAGEKNIWFEWQYLGIALVTWGWLAFALEYSGHHGLWSQSLKLAVGILFAVFQVLAFSNAYHHFVWRSAAEPVPQQPGPLAFEVEMGFTLHSIFSYSVMLLAFIILLRAYWRARSIYRSQYRLLIIATFLPLFTNLVYSMGTKDEINLSPALFSLSSIAIMWGIFNHRLLNIAPIARSIIMENIKDAVLTVDMQGRIIDMNANFERLLNRPLDDVIGKQLENVLAHWPECVRYHPYADSITEEVSLPLMSGERQEFELHISSVIDSGKPLGRVIMLRNITGRRRAERAVMEERNLLRTLIDNLPHSIYVKDKQSRFLLNNIASIRANGAETQEDLEGKSDFDLLPESRAKEWREQEKELFRTGKPVTNYETYTGNIIPKERWLSVTKVPLYDTEGEDIIGLVGINYDVTEIKRAESQIRETAGLLRATLEAVNEGIIVFDGEGRVICYNQNFLDLWKLPYEWPDIPDFNQRFQMLASRVQYPEKFVERGRELRENLDTHEHDLIEFIDGRIIERFSRPYRINDQTVGRLCGYRDVTERLNDQRERERLIESLDAFAHTVAHDLKSILGLIRLSAEDLQMNFNSLSAKDALFDLGVVINNSHKASHIIDSLLLLASVPQMDQITLTLLKMDQVIQAAKSRLQHEMKENRVIFAQPSEWPQALGYAPWVEEVWYNYISNAIKYGGDPPRIELGADILPDNRVRYWVRDNGAGLTGDQKKQLFRPFQRLEQVWNKEGQGLGLSVVKRVIEKLGGEVGVESTPGEGSTFSFTLWGKSGEAIRVDRGFFEDVP
jgi:PAS domain S-box-containing protein